MSRTTGRGRIARAAISAALTGAMALGGVVGPVATAFAAPTITIKDDQGKKVDTYKKYVQVFTATIDNTANENGAKATGVNWVTNESVKTAVINFLKQERDTEGNTPTGASQTYLEWLKAEHLVDQGVTTADLENNATVKAEFEKAGNVANYIGIEIGKANQAGETYDTETTNPNVPHIAQGFASKLASALSAETVDITYEVDAKSFSLGDTSGYYVLTGDGGVTPIWLPYDASSNDPLDLWQKAKLPTFQKEGKEDGSNPAKVTDAGVGDTVTFTLTGTLPASDTAYEKGIAFFDRLPAGLTLDASSIKITSQLGKEGEASDITSRFSITTTPGTADDGYEYSFKAESLVGATFGGNASNDTILILTYTVTVNENVGMGNEGLNTNSAKFKYGENDIATENLASVASFGIELIKTNTPDEGAEATPLPDAKFTFQNADPNSNTYGQYIQADGSMADASYAFTTEGADALLSANKIDAGYYTVSEVQAPSGYEPVADFVLHVMPTYDSVTGELTDLDGEIGAFEGSTFSTVTNAAVSVTAKDAGTGIVTITVKDSDEEIRLPITGMTPSQLGTITGVVLVAAGAFMVLRRRQAEQA